MICLTILIGKDQLLFTNYFLASMSQGSAGKKTINGFKFSFKRDGIDGRQTPKFASIQLDSKDLHQSKQKPMERSTKSARRSLKKLEDILTNYPRQKQQYKQIRVNRSHRNIVLRTETQQNHFILNNGDKVTPSLDSKKILTTPRPKKTDLLKNLSFQRLDKQPLSPDEDERQLNGSYLQIFKRQKKKLRPNRSKTNLNTLNLTLKNQTESINFQEKRDQSPKSYHSNNSNRSFRQPPKIFNKFFPKNDDMQQLIEDAAVFPETTKSKRFNQETPTQFFRRIESKKNMGISKALFKSQKTNVNVRLNNIGGGISKLNIRID